MSLSTRILAGAAAAVSLAGIASAAVPDKADTAKPLDVLVHYDAKRGKYCITDPNSVTTGTLLPRTACKTQQEWESEGVHIAHR